MDAHMPGWLWPIAALGGLGALIDFLIGRVGQDRTRDLLESWWVSFDDIKWSNFGRKEASFAISLIGFICGDRFLSIKRICFVTSIVVMLLIIDTLVIPHIPRNVAMVVSTSVEISILSVLISAFAFSISISYTRQISLIVLRLYKDSSWRNLIVIIIFFMFSYLILVLWLPLIQAISLLIQLKAVEYMSKWKITLSESTIVFAPGESIFGFIYRNMKPISLNPKEMLSKLFSGFWFPYTSPGEVVVIYLQFTKLSLEYLANFTRITLAMTFLVLSLTKPFLMDPLSLLWRRVAETDKPIFTLVLGGIGSIATAGNELLKHL
jgi:hypothetical protein